MSRFNWLSTLPQRRILCIGDIMFDRFTYGDVDRISPEAPIPVMKITRETEMLGGVGNVAANIMALGGEAIVLGVIGDDAIGHKTQSLAMQIFGAPLLVEKGRQTTFKQRFVARSQQMLRADSETTQAITAETAKALYLQAVGLLPACDAVILSDYLKGVLTPALTAQLISAANHAGKPVLADPKDKEVRKYRGASIIKPNQSELAMLTGAKLTDDNSVVLAARDVLQRGEIEAIVVTRSAKGMLVVTQKGEMSALPTEARAVSDVSGAGDTVLAALALGVSSGVSLSEAAALANIAAGIVVSKPGTATASLAEIDHALRQDPALESSDKLLTMTQLPIQLQRWRELNLKIGFTNGVFDLLHPGHLASLAFARGQCDALIVGVNSDASVKRLKGEGRPIQNEMVRAHMLAALSAVDGVVIFDADTPETLIKTVQPDVLVKGGDYNPDTVVGADIVQARGGKVLIAPRVGDFSTTNTISKLQGN